MSLILMFTSNFQFRMLASNLKGFYGSEYLDKKSDTKRYDFLNENVCTYLEQKNT